MKGNRNGGKNVIFNRPLRKRKGSGKKIESLIR
jgi:hypothetical protein